MPDLFVSPDEKDFPSSPPVIPDKVPSTEAEKIEIQDHNHRLFSSFCLYPDDVDFETREDKEKIVLLLRQHPIVNLKWILGTILLLTGPTLISAFGIFSLLPTGFPLIISLAWYLITSAYAIEGFLNWYFNVYFITTQRVVDVDFYNLIDKRVSDAEIDKIQDVSYMTGGVIRTMFNYGDVTIQTAAEVPEFHFNGVPSPERVTKILDELRMKIKK
ncbi:MAG TPA: PH domain-containing protein [Patescibacteria group bacterium]|nr:PH domain-containing protein [Patescibacteria group bacterium]